MKNNKGFSAVVILLSIITITVIGFAGWFVWSINNKELVLNNYEECAAQEGAVIQESYPEVCVYKDQRFINPNQTIDPDANQLAQDDNKKYLEIKEWGIKIPLSDEIKDAKLGEFTYGTTLSPESPTVDIVFVSTTSAPSGCQINEDNKYGMGSIVRETSKPQQNYSVANLDGYGYSFYKGNGGACSYDADTGEPAQEYGELLEAFVTATKNIESL